MSFIIRMELSNQGNVYLMGSYDTYNIVITAHGVLMIFFMVMPVLIGGFGKNPNMISLKKNFFFFI